jgi:uncharacterized protein YuzE
MIAGCNIGEASTAGGAEMKSKRIDRWSVNITTAPTVQIDTEAGSAYVRFKRAKIARTLRHGSRWPIVTIDLDAHGQLVGLEFVGVKKFNLGYLLRRVRLKAPSAAVGRANYISAEAHQIAA